VAEEMSQVAAPIEPQMMTQNNAKEARGFLSTEEE
jgi:hypothetical protein